MSKYKKDRTRIWVVGVREHSEHLGPTSLKWFHTRKQCQEYINEFRAENPEWYKNMEHKPMCYYPAGMK